jgi:hypothetical protein
MASGEVWSPSNGQEHVNSFGVHAICQRTKNRPYCGDWLGLDLRPDFLILTRRSGEPSNNLEICIQLHFQLLLFMVAWCDARGNLSYRLSIYWDSKGGPGGDSMTPRLLRLCSAVRALCKHRDGTLSVAMLGGQYFRLFAVPFRFYNILCFVY